MVMGPQLYHSPSAIRGGGGSVAVNPATGAITLTPGGVANVTVASGQMIVPDGALATLGLAFTGGLTTGLYRRASSVISLVMAGARVIDFQAGPLQLISTGSFQWASGDPGSTSGDTKLFRDAANTIAQRNAAAAQILRIYNTWTDASNYERASLNWTTNVFSLMTAAAGSGTLRGLNIQAAGGALGHYGVTPVAIQTVTGSKVGGAALADLLTKLAAWGAIIDGTSA